MHSALAHPESGPVQLIGKSTANFISRRSYVQDMQRHSVYTIQ